MYAIRSYYVLTGTVLGMIPGCMGTFTVVSLYTHRLLSFGALVAAMIATSGDEAYFMLALMPEKALLIFAVLTVLAIVITSYSIHYTKLYDGAA